MDSLKNVIERIPISILLVLYLGYLVSQYYAFENDDQSPKIDKTRMAQGLKQTNSRLQTKYKELDLFAKSLEDKKSELRSLAKELQEVKAVLSENIDIPGFMKMVTTEAKKVNFSVLGLKPLGEEKHQYYAEQVFSMSFRGVYPQLLVFLSRLSNLNRIIQVRSLKMAVDSANSGKYVVLLGELELKVFQYLGSSEDNLGKPANGNASEELPNASPNSGRPLEAGHP